MTRSLSALLMVMMLAALPDTLTAEDGPGEFSIRPVIPLPEPALVELRRLVADDDEARSMGAEIVSHATNVVMATPRPLAVIHYEGLVNTDPRRLRAVEHLRTLDDVALLVQAWQVSKRDDFAAAVRRQVHAWATTYRPTGNDVNENKLIPLLVGWHAIRHLADDTERRDATAWLSDLGERHARAVTESKHLTNRYTKHVRLAVYCGLALERPAWVALGRTGIERFVSQSLRADGTSLDLERRDSLTYHCSALVPVLELAQLLGADGQMLYAWVAPAGGSVKHSVDFVLPYATGEKTHAEWVNTTVELDRRRAAAGLEHYRTGRLFEPRQAAKLLEAASQFDASLLPVWTRVTGSTAKRFGNWRMVVQASLNPLP